MFYNKHVWYTHPVIIKFLFCLVDDSSEEYEEHQQQDSPPPQDLSEMSDQDTRDFNNTSLESSPPSPSAGDTVGTDALPLGLSLQPSAADSGLGVWARVDIPQGVKFGPLPEPITDKVDDVSQAWQVRILCIYIFMHRPTRHMHILDILLLLQSQIADTRLMFYHYVAYSEFVSSLRINLEIN
jgi:hypothetical protein